MKLQDTVDWMLSDDYRDRFRAEYWQLRIRADKMKVILNRHRRNELNFEPNCPYNLLEYQLSVMDDLLGILERRAEIEGINLNINRR